MKKLLLFSIFLTTFLFSKSQVPNDDCSTATDLGLFPSQVSPPCQTGLAPYYGYINNLINATPSFPYFYISGCWGYDSVTTSLADDIWYKYGGNYSNQTKVYIWGEDTVHVNFYYGTNCNNLNSSGCFTFVPSYGDTIINVYAEKNLTSSVNYIQISSNVPGKQFGIVVCIDQPFGTFSYPVGTIHVNNNTNILNNPIKTFDFNIIPNPTSGEFNLYLNSLEKIQSVEIIDVIGRMVYVQKIESFDKELLISLPNEISNGIYNCIITSDYARVSRKIVVVKQ